MENMSNVFNHKNKPHMQKHVSIEAHDQQQLTETHSYLLHLGGVQKHIPRTILCFEGTVLFLGVFSNTGNSPTIPLLNCVLQYGVLNLQLRTLLMVTFTTVDCTGLAVGSSSPFF